MIKKVWKRLWISWCIIFEATRGGVGCGGGGRMIRVKFNCEVSNPWWRIAPHSLRMACTCRSISTTLWWWSFRGTQASFPCTKHPCQGRLTISLPWSDWTRETQIPMLRRTKASATTSTPPPPHCLLHTKFCKVDMETINVQDWSPHMSFFSKGSQISALQLKRSFKSKTSI